jgi:hypothetical protein
MAMLRGMSVRVDHLATGAMNAGKKERPRNSRANQRIAPRLPRPYRDIGCGEPSFDTGIRRLQLGGLS